MHELVSALRRRTEAGTLAWTLLQLDLVIHMEARVRGVTLLLVWHCSKHRPDLMLHTSSRVLLIDDPGLCGLWDIAYRVAKPAVADYASDQAIIAGTARMVDADSV